MSRLFRRQRLAGLAALVGLGGLLAAGCSGSGGSAAPAGLEETHLVVAAVPAVDSAGLYIAQQRGLFKAEGLTVTILKATSGATTIPSQLQGKFQVTSGNYVSYILANAAAKNPADFRVLAPGSIMESNGQDIMVLPDSRIRTVGQLSNQKIAVNAPHNIGQLLVSSLLTDNAVTVNPDQFVSVPFPEMTQALRQHKVAAAWMPEPFITAAEESTGAIPLADSNQGSAENLPISGYMVTATWLKKNPNTAAAFRRAILKAQAIAATDPGAIEQSMERFAGVPQMTSAIAADPQFPTQSNSTLLRRLASLMLNFNMIGQAYDVNQMLPKFK